MRSRFTAFVLNDGEYLYSTHHPGTRKSLSVEQLTQSAIDTRWIKLKVKSSCIVHDIQGYVEFVAYALNQDKLLPHHENSEFRHVDGRWVYYQGCFPSRTLVPIRLSRNEICPCGSGLKFKRCCLRG